MQESPEVALFVKTAFRWRLNFGRELNRKSKTPKSEGFPSSYGGKKIKNKKINKETSEKHLQTTQKKTARKQKERREPELKPRLRTKQF